MPWLRHGGWLAPRFGAVDLSRLPLAAGSECYDGGDDAAASAPGSYAAPQRRQNRTLAESGNAQFPQTPLGDEGRLASWRYDSGSGCAPSSFGAGRDASDAVTKPESASGSAWVAHGNVGRCAQSSGGPGCGAGTVGVRD